MKRVLLCTSALFGLLTLAPTNSVAEPITVTYTVTGSSGNWLLDFSVTNNVVAGQKLYLFAVLLPDQDIVNSPGNFIIKSGTINPSFAGGPNLDYNNIWRNQSRTGIVFGGTLSGFEVIDLDAVAPISVQWLAATIDPTAGCTNCPADSTGNNPYLGNDNYNNGVSVPGFLASKYNPGFVGTASAIPEPSTIALLGMGLCCFPGLLRKRRR